MEGRRKSRWYRAAKWFALAFVFALAFIFYFALRPSASSDCANCLTVQSNAPLLLGLAALCFTGIGTISSVLLGWRSERRQAAESRLRIAQLELQVAQARAEAERAN